MNIKPIESFEVVDPKVGAGEVCKTSEVRQLEQEHQDTLNFMDDLLDIIINSEEAKKDAEATLYLIKSELLKAKGE